MSRKRSAAEAGVEEPDVIRDVVEEDAEGNVKYRRLAGGDAANAAEDDEVATYYDVEPHDARIFGKKFKPTLDSDEEDDEEAAERYNIMNPREIEGEERETILRDGDIKITPFNMKDELEEGHFDKDGTFIFNRDKDDVKDYWLDNIDKVEIMERKTSKNEEEEEDEPVDKVECYQVLVGLLSPGDSVEAALRKLGKKTKPAMKRGNRGSNSEQAKEDELKKWKEELLKITEMADKIMGTGDMDIYQKTREQLEQYIQNHVTQNAQASSEPADMFADDFDPTAKTEPVKSANDDDEQNQVLWEFRWEDKDDAPVYGPHTSQEMLAWKDADYFKDGVWVRQTKKRDGPFYNSKRVDFDLYT